MKMKSLLPAVAALAFLAGTASPALAASGWWNASSGNWTDTSKWDTAATGNSTVLAVPVAGQTATFNADRGNGTSSTVYLGGNQSASSVTFNNSATTTLLGGTEGGATVNNTLTLTGGITASAGAGAVTIGDTSVSPASKVDILLNNSQSFTNSSTSLFTIANGVSAFGAARTLTLAGTGTITTGGALSDGSGAVLSLAATNTGTITISGANTYTGTTTLNGNGFIQIASDSAFGNGGNVSISSGKTPVLQATGSNRTISNPVIIVGALTLNGTNSFTLSGAVTSGNSNPSLTNNISGGLLTLGNVYLSELSGTGRAITLAGTGNTTIGGVIANFNGSGTAGSVTVSNTGTTTFGSANTFNGTLTHSAASGSLVLKDQNALQFAAYNKTGAANLVFDSSVVANAFTFGSLAGSTALTLQNNDVSPAAIALTAGGNNGNTTYSGAISGNGSLAKAGTGALTLSGANTFAGGATIQQGTVLISNTSSTTNATINSSPLGIGNLTLQDGVILASTGGTSRAIAQQNIFLNGNITLTQNVTNNGRVQVAGAWNLGGGNRSIDIGKTAAAIGSGNEGMTFSQPTGFASPSVTNGALLLKSSSGNASTPAQVRFNTTNFTGNTALTVDDGVVLTAQNGSFFGTGTNAPKLALNADSGKGGGVLQLGDLTNVMRSAEVYSLSGGGLITASNTATAGNTGTVTINNGGGATFSGNITNASFGKIALTKSGAGTQSLAGVNTYTGNTTVTAGTLLLDGGGSLTGSTVAVNGGTFGGNGTITGDVTVANLATLQAGVSNIDTATLTLNGNLTASTTSIISLGLGSSVSTHDILARTGGTWTFATNQAFTFIDQGAVGGTTYTGIITGLGADPGVGSWAVNNGWTGTFTYNAGSVDFALAAIPEPGTWILVGIGLAFLLYRKPRRRIDP